MKNTIVPSMVCYNEDRGNSTWTNHFCITTLHAQAISTKMLLLSLSTLIGSKIKLISIELWIASSSCQVPSEHKRLWLPIASYLLQLLAMFSIFPISPIPFSHPFTQAHQINYSVFLFFWPSIYLVSIKFSNPSFLYSIIEFKEFTLEQRWASISFNYKCYDFTLQSATHLWP